MGSRRFVVDADVARGSASADAEARLAGVNGRSLAFREALKALRDAQHRVVFGPSSQAEWSRHNRGSFGRSWLVTMEMRGLVERLEHDPERGWLDERVTAMLPEEERDAACKDVHLVVVACHADQRVLSGDDKARRCFGRIAEGEQRLEQLHWVNPTGTIHGLEAAAITLWLSEGAEARPELQLRCPPASAQG